MFQSIANVKREEVRSVMRHLTFVCIMIILMDITLLGTEYANQYEIETTYKSTLYSIKLKLEFAILNRLRNLVKSQQKSSLSCGSPDVPLPLAEKLPQPGHSIEANTPNIISFATTSDGRSRDETLLLTT